MATEGEKKFRLLRTSDKLHTWVIFSPPVSEADSPLVRGGHALTDFFDSLKAAFGRPFYGFFLLLTENIPPGGLRRAEKCSIIDILIYRRGSIP